MPNQLSASKRRQSVAEHEAVLDVLADVARREGVAVMDLHRQAIRSLLREKAALPEHAASVKKLLKEKSPRAPDSFRTPAELARFKKAQREFDRVLMDLGVATAEGVQQHNAIASSRNTVRLIEFEEVHASA